MNGELTDLVCDGCGTTVESDTPEAVLWTVYEGVLLNPRRARWAVEASRSMASVPSRTFNDAECPACQMAAAAEFWLLPGERVPEDSGVCGGCGAIVPLAELSDDDGGAAPPDESMSGYCRDCGPCNCRDCRMTRASS
jgi:hypothetical protein